MIVDPRTCTSDRPVVSKSLQYNALMPHVGNETPSVRAECAMREARLLAAWTRMEEGSVRAKHRRVTVSEYADESDGIRSRSPWRMEPTRRGTRLRPLKPIVRSP